MQAPKTTGKYQSRLRPTPAGAALKATKCVGCEAKIARLDEESRRAETAAEREALGRLAGELMVRRYLSPEATARHEWFCRACKDPEGYHDRLLVAQQEAKARCREAYAAVEPKQEELF